MKVICLQIQRFGAVWNLWIAIHNYYDGMISFSVIYNGTKELRTPEDFFKALQISIKGRFWVRICSLISRHYTFSLLMHSRQFSWFSYRFLVVSETILFQNYDTFSSKRFQKTFVFAIAASKLPKNFLFDLDLDYMSTILVPYTPY